MVHFGNRAVSLEQFGVPSTFVLRSDALEEAQKLKVKEALLGFVMTLEVILLSVPHYRSLCFAVILLFNSQTALVYHGAI